MFKDTKGKYVFQWKTAHHEKGDVHSHIRVPGS